VLGAAVRPRPRAIGAISDRQLGRVTIALGAAGIALAGLAVYASLPPNAIQVPEGLTKTAQVLMPQGWGFFTARATNMKKGE